MHYAVLLIQMQNISLRSLGMRRKQNLEIDFFFSRSFLPSSFAFLALFFFSFAGHRIGFISVGKVLGKSFRILGLDERKGRWIVEPGFYWHV